MECTLATLIACFSWSGLYLDSSISAQDYGYGRTHQEQPLICTSDMSECFAYRMDFKSRNPYGRIALGFEVHLSAVSLSLEAAHISSISASDDNGINSIGLRARWHPFRSR